MQSGSDQTLDCPTIRALGNSHCCQTCNSSQGGTIKIKARIEHLCAVFRLNNRPLMDQGKPCSMAYVCVKPRVPKQGHMIYHALTAFGYKFITNHNCTL